MGSKWAGRLKVRAWLSNFCFIMLQSEPESGVGEAWGLEGTKGGCRGAREQRLKTGAQWGLFGGEGQGRALALWSARPGAGGLMLL